MTLAIIPARGGSKRIPRKNLRVFCGKPMIVWSIEAAQESGCFERIVVSTDDEEIAEVAREHGAEVPFMRPAELSDDHTGTTPVVAHAARSCDAADDDLVCCIYATTPFLRAEDLVRGGEVLEASGAEYAFTVTSYASPIQRALRLTSEGRVEMLDPSAFETRSQDLEEVWHDAGQFYWGRARAWKAGTPIFSRNAVPIPLSRHRVQDIDTEEDWTLAERLFRAGEIGEGDGR
jgi:pseudaminic acid cytidylyltransferase